MMMSDNKKKIATLIVGSAPSEKSSQRSEEYSSSMESDKSVAEKEAVRKLMAAFSNKDVPAAVKFLKEFMDCYEASEEESEYGKSDVPFGGKKEEY